MTNREATQGGTPGMRRVRDSLIAAALGAAAVTFVVHPALAASPPKAEPANRAPVTAAAPQKAPEQGASKQRSRPKNKKSAQPAKAAPEASAKPEATAKPEANKGDGKPRKVAARGEASKRRGDKAKKKKAPPKPCLGPTLQFDRGGIEVDRITLVDCAGKPREEARRQLSVLARPWAAPHPGALPAPAPAPAKGEKEKPKGKGGPRGKAADAGEIAPGVRLLDPGLLVRIDALARRYPGKPISLVSGYRPQSRGSLHQSARALDLRIAGVRNDELAAACRALPDTGCGYYPNSSFVHIDVRAPGTGSVTWIDASGPGEAPRYVSAWPPPGDAPEAEHAPAAQVAADEAAADE